MPPWLSSFFFFAFLRGFSLRGFSPLSFIFPFSSVGFPLVEKSAVSATQVQEVPVGYRYWSRFRPVAIQSSVVGSSPRDDRRSFIVSDLATDHALIFGRVVILGGLL
jgi:hypothetical protein